MSAFEAAREFPKYDNAQGLHTLFLNFDVMESLI